jgi:transposase
VSFVCANRFCVTTFVETMAPAIIGTVFKNERRQTPLLMELDRVVMRALLKLPRINGVSRRKTFRVAEKFRATAIKAFVEVKTEEEQSVLMLHRTRRLFVRQRTMLINAIRAHMAEFGIIAGIGRLTGASKNI